MIMGKKSRWILKCSLFIGLAVLAAGCSLFGPQDGSIRIQLVGAAEHNGEWFTYVLYAADSSPKLVGYTQADSGSTAIASGRADISLAGGREFTGGTEFTISAFIDLPPSGGTPMGGVDYELKPEYHGTVDGDTVVQLVYPANFFLSTSGNAQISLYKQTDYLKPVYSSENLGTAYIHFPLSYEFIIRNDGNALLELTGSPPVGFSGSSSDFFTIMIPPAAANLLPGEETEFHVRITPDTPGNRTAVMTIPYQGTELSAFITTLSVLVSEPAAALPRTGQSIPVADGDDGTVQAGVPWPVSRFTDNSDGTVTDNLTGLMWQGEPYYSIYAPAGLEWGASIQYAENLILGGYDDWRLPNVNELTSLVHHGVSDTADWLNGIDGFSRVRGDAYWSSTRNYTANYTAMGHAVNMDTGGLWRQNISYYGSFAYVIAVRDAAPGVIELPKTGKTSSSRPGDDGDLEKGCAWPDPRFLQSNGIVYDALTGLQWKQDPYPSKIAWNDALAYTNDLEYAGYDDWRLPNRHEMRSLVSYGSVNNSVRLAQAFDTAVEAEDFWWTATTYASAYGDGSAFVIYLDTGTSDYLAKTQLHRCWAVRGGAAQSGNPAQ